MNSYTLFIDSAKSPRTALVQSASTNPIQMPDFVAGDKVAFSFFFTNNGLPDTTLNGTNITYKVALGTFAVGIYASSSLWATGSFGVTGSLDLSNGILTGSFNGADYVSAIIELEGSQSTGRTTYLQTPVTIWNQLLK
jgi:hypothetical protein